MIQQTPPRPCPSFNVTSPLERNNPAAPPESPTGLGGFNVTSPLERNNPLR